MTSAPVVAPAASEPPKTAAQASPAFSAAHAAGGAFAILLNLLGKPVASGESALSVPNAKSVVAKATGEPPPDSASGTMAQPGLAIPILLPIPAMIAPTQPATTVAKPTSAPRPVTTLEIKARPAGHVPQELPL